MKVNLNVGAENMDGVVMVDEKGKPVLLNGLCVNALLADYQGEVLTGAQKLDRYKLAKRLHVTADEIEITVEEAALIKELVAKSYTPLVVGNVYAALEA